MCKRAIGDPDGSVRLCSGVGVEENLTTSTNLPQAASSIVTDQHHAPVDSDSNAEAICSCGHVLEGHRQYVGLCAPGISRPCCFEGCECTDFELDDEAEAIRRQAEEAAVLDAAINEQERMARGCLLDGYRAGIADGYEAGVEAAAEMMRAAAGRDERGREALLAVAAYCSAGVRGKSRNMLEAKARMAQGAFVGVRT